MSYYATNNSKVHPSGPKDAPLNTKKEAVVTERTRVKQQSMGQQTYNENLEKFNKMIMARVTNSGHTSEGARETCASKMAQCNPLQLSPAHVAYADIQEVEEETFSSGPNVYRPWMKVRNKSSSKPKIITPNKIKLKLENKFESLAVVVENQMTTTTSDEPVTGFDSRPGESGSNEINLLKSTIHMKGGGSTSMREEVMRQCASSKFFKELLKPKEPTVEPTKSLPKKPALSNSTIGSIPTRRTFDIPERSRPLMSTGAIDCFLSPNLNTKDVTGKQTSNLERFNSMANTLFRSGMHTQRASTKTSSIFGGDTFGMKRPLSSIINNINLQFASTQVISSETLASKRPEDIPQCKKIKVGSSVKDIVRYCANGRFSACGTVELACGSCSSCKANFKLSTNTGIVDDVWRRRPMVAQNINKTINESVKTTKHSKERLERFLRYSKPIFKLLRKREVVDICLAGNPVQVTSIYATTNGHINKESDMLGPDMGITMYLNKLSINSVKYILYSFNNGSLTHYVDLDDEIKFNNFLKTKPKYSKIPKIEIMPMKMSYTRYDASSPKYQGAIALHRMVLKIVTMTSFLENHNRVNEDNYLKCTRIGNRVLIPLPSIKEKIKSAFDRAKDIGGRLTGHLAVAETLLQSDKAYLGTTYGHRCGRCKGITVLTDGHTGDKYEAGQAVDRGRIYNSIKSCANSNKELADIMSNTMLIRGHDKTGLTTDAGAWQTQCGFCGHDIIEDYPSIIQEILFDAVEGLRNVKMGLLHHLEKMGYLDGAALDTTGESNIISNDLQTIQHQLSRMRQDVVAIPSLIPADIQTALMNGCPEIEIRSRVIPTIHDNAAYAITTCLLATIASSNDYQNTYSYCKDNFGVEGILPTNLFDFDNNIFPNLIDGEIASIDITARNTLVFDMNILRVHPSKLIRLCKENGITQVYCVVPMFDCVKLTDKSICNGELQFRRVEDQVYAITSWSDRPVLIMRDNMHMWMNADVLEYDGYMHSMEWVRSIGDLALRKMIISEANIEDIPRFVETVGNEIQIAIPVLYTYVRSGRRKFSMTGERKVTLNRELYRRMMIRNVSGTNSFKELVEYGIGVSNMKYNINETTVSIGRVDHNAIKCTAAFVFSKMITRSNSLVVTEKVISSLNSLEGFLAAFTISSIESFLNMYGLDDNVISIANQWMREGTNITYMNGIMKNINDLDLDSLLCYSREPRIFQVFDQDYLTVVPKGTCDHDPSSKLEEGRKICECCNLSSAVDELGYCMECQPKDKHKCLHKCNGKHPESGKMRCSCCLLPIGSDKCACCDSFDKLEEHVIEMADVIIAEDAERRNVIRTDAIPKSKRDTVSHKERPTEQSKQRAIEPPRIAIVSYHQEERASSGDKSKDVATELIDVEALQTQSTSHTPETGETEGARTMVSLKNTELERVEQWKMRLMKYTNEFYADLFAYGALVGYHNHEKDIMPPNTQKLRSYFKFIPMGESFANVEDVRIVKTFKTSGEGNLCGFNALEMLFPGKNLSLEELREVSGSDDFFSSDQLGNYALLKGLNLVIYMHTGVLIAKGEESDEFGVICHSKALGIDLMHWEAALAVQTGFTGITPYFRHGINETDRRLVAKRNGISPSQRSRFTLGNPKMLELEVKCYDEVFGLIAEHGQMDFKLVRHKDSQYLTNDPQKLRMLPSKGLFTVRVATEYLSLVEKLRSAFITPNKIVCEDWFYDRSDELPDNTTVGILNECNQSIRDIAEIISASKGDIDSGKIITYHESVSYERKSDQCFKISRVGKYKPGDVVFGKAKAIEGNERLEKKITGFVIDTSDDWLTCVTGSCPKAKGMSVSVTRKNTGSPLRNVFSILRNDFRRDIKQLVDRAVAVDAVPGWGKSTEIVAMADDQTTVVALTSAAVQNIKDKLYNAGKANVCRVCSIEKAKLEPARTKKLIIDEASMITWETLCLITGEEVMDLYLYGNTQQICIVDMHSTAGIRGTKSILEQCKNVTRHMQSRRIGNPLASELAIVCKGFDTIADHNTEFSTLSWADMQWDDLNALVASMDNPTILCFYNNCVRSVKNRVRHRCIVDTVHKYQGLEADHVIVLQWTQRYSSPGRITLDKNQCLSAATRAKKKLIWISVSEYASGVPLHKRLGLTVGGFSDVGSSEQFAKTDWLIRIASRILSNIIICGKDKTIDRLEMSRMLSESEGKLVAIRHTVGSDDVKYLQVDNGDKTMELTSIMDRSWSMGPWKKKKDGCAEAEPGDMAALSKITEEKNKNKNKINEDLKRIYEVNKKEAREKNLDVKSVLESVIGGVINQGSSSVKTICNLDPESDVMHVAVKMAGINLFNIDMDFSKDQIGIQAKGLRAAIAKSANLKDLYNNKYECCDYYITKHDGLNDSIRVKKRLRMERLAWIVNYFGVALEAGNMKMRVSFDTTVIEFGSYGGCSICGGVMIWHNAVPIMVIDPAYDTGDERCIHYNKFERETLSLLCAYLELPELIEVEELDVVELPPATRSDFSVFDDQNIMTALVFERVIKAPWMTLNKIKKIVSGNNDDLCDFYDNNDVSVTKTIKARLSCYGFEEINTTLVNMNSMDLRKRPVTCRYKRTYYSAVMDDDNAIWVTRICGKKNELPNAVVEVNKGNFKKIVIKLMLKSLPFWLTRVKTRVDKPMGATSSRGPLIRSMARHEQDNDEVANAARKFRGQIESKVMKIRSKKIYVPIYMREKYDEACGKLLSQYQIISTSTPYPDNSLMGLVELLVTQTIYHSGVEKATYVTDNPCTTVLCGMWGWFSTPTESAWHRQKFKAGEACAITNLANVKAIYDSEIAKLKDDNNLTEVKKEKLRDKEEKSQKIHKQIMGEESVWYGTSYNQNNRDRIIIAMNSVDITTEELLRLWNWSENGSIIMCIPSRISTPGIGMHSVENPGAGGRRIMFSGKSEVVRVNQDVEYCLDTGKSLEREFENASGEPQKIRMYTNTRTVHASVKIVEVKFSQVQASQCCEDMIIPFSPFQHHSEGEKVWVQYPRITCSLGDGPENRLIIKKCRRLVGKRMMVKLYERALRSDCTLKDLQSYGRSYLMTQVYTERYIHSVNKEGLDELEAGCLAALAEKSGLNDQLEETMKVLDKFRYNETDKVSDIVMKSCSKAIFEKWSSLLHKAQEWFEIPDTFSEVLDKLVDNTRIVLMDERTGEQHEWTWSRNFTDNDRVGEKIGKWWTKTMGLEWMNVGMIDEYRKVICRSSRRPRSSKQPGILKQIIDVAKSITEQKEHKQSDWSSRIVALPEPVPLIGDASLSDVLNRAVLTGSRKTEIDPKKTVEIRRAIRTAPWVRLTQYAANVKEIIQSLGDLQVSDIVAGLKEAIRMMRSDVKDQKIVWFVKEQVQELTRMENLSDHEATKALQLLKESYDRGISGSRTNKERLSIPQWIHQFSEKEEVDDSAMDEAAAILKIDIPVRGKENLLVDECGSRLEVTDARKLREKIRKNWTSLIEKQRVPIVTGDSSGYIEEKQTLEDMVSRLPRMLLEELREIESISNVARSGDADSTQKCDKDAEVSNMSILCMPDDLGEDFVYSPLTRKDWHLRDLIDSLQCNTVYDIQGVRMEILYEPQDDNDCVWDCVRWFMRKYVIKHYNHSNAIKSIMNQQKMLNEVQTVVLCAILGISTMIIESDGTAKLYVFDIDAPIIQLLRVRQGADYDHCVLVRVLDCDCLKRNDSADYDESEELSRTISCEIDKGACVRCKDPKTRCENHVHIETRAINEALRTLQVGHELIGVDGVLHMPKIGVVLPRLTRKTNCISLLRAKCKLSKGDLEEANGQAWAYLATPQLACRAGDCILLMDTGAVNVAMCMAVHILDEDGQQQQAIVLSKYVGELAIGWDIGMHVLDVKNTKEIRSEKTILGSENWSLNVQTQKYVEQELGVKCPQGSGSGVLHVFHYDNREHHLYDESQRLLEHDDNTLRIWINKEVTVNAGDLKCYLRERGLIRAAILYGNPTWICYLEGQKSVSMLKRLLDAMQLPHREYNNNIIIDMQVGREEIAFINSMMKEHIAMTANNTTKILIREAESRMSRPEEVAMELFSEQWKIATVTQRLKQLTGPAITEEAMKRVYRLKHLSLSEWMTKNTFYKSETCLESRDGEELYHFPSETVIRTEAIREDEEDDDGKIIVDNENSCDEITEVDKEVKEKSSDSGSTSVNDVESELQISAISSDSEEQMLAAFKLETENITHEIVSKAAYTIQTKHRNRSTPAYNDGNGGELTQITIDYINETVDGSRQEDMEKIARILMEMTQDNEETLLGLKPSRLVIDEEGCLIPGVNMNKRWEVNYEGVQEDGSNLKTYNPGWWYLAYREMRAIKMYNVKHEIDLNMRYAGNNAYRLNRIKFREAESTFTHNVKPEVFWDLINYRSSSKGRVDAALQQVATRYFHGRVSWHVIFGRSYNLDFLGTCVDLLGKMERVVVATDEPSVFTELKVNYGERLIVIRVASNNQPYRAIWWRFMILFADIPEDCELYILNGRGMNCNDLGLVDRVMEEPFDGHDVVSALHCQTFNVCCGFAKYDHRKFTDYTTFNDLYIKYGNSYGGDEIYMSRYKIKMMWLYYLIPTGCFYAIEGKWMNYAADTTICIEKEERARITIPGVSGLFCMANFFTIKGDTKGVYDYTSIKWRVRDILWKPAMNRLSQRLKMDVSDSSRKGDVNWICEVDNWELSPTLSDIDIKRIEDKLKKYKETGQHMDPTKMAATVCATCIPLMVCEGMTCDYVGPPINAVEASRPITYVEIINDNNTKKVIVTKVAPNHLTNRIKTHIKLLSTSGEAVAMGRMYYDLIRKEWTGKKAIVEGCFRIMSMLATDETRIKNIYKTSEENVIVKLPDNTDRVLSNLMACEVEVKACEGILTSKCDVLKQALSLKSKSAWKEHLSGLKAMKLIDFDRKILSSHSESEGKTLKRQIGKVMGIKQLREVVVAECEGHVESTDVSWLKMVYDSSAKLEILPLNGETSSPGKLACVQRMSDNNFGVLCQGVCVKKKVNVSQSGGGSTTTVSTETETEPAGQPASWNAWVSSGSSNQLPFGFSAAEYQEKLRGKIKETPEARLEKLENINFDDAYALLHHGLEDISLRGDESKLLLSCETTVKADYDIIEPIGGDLCLDGHTENLRHNEANAEVLDLWEDTDLSDWLTVYAPKNKMSLTMRLEPGARKINLKTILCDAPVYSRPVPTKVMGMAENAVTGRLGSVLVLRKGEFRVSWEHDKFRRAYYRKGWESLVADYKANPVTLSDADIKTWLSRRSDWKRLADSTIKMLESGLPSNPINAVNVHVKTEALLKADPIRNWKQTKGRIIVWQPKELCAIMSPAFITIKRRLKQVLRDEIVYTDGLTPDMISARCRTLEFDYIFEDDLEKQDRQTDQNLINLEFSIMLELGLDESLASLWRLVHNRWRFKGQNCWGQLDAMRLTGQATTALGNAITNLCVHSNFVLEHRRSVRLMMILGDDNICFMKEKPNLMKYKRLMSDRYNMISKPFVNENIGTFCSLICYRSAIGTCEVGPDLVRMRRRFEVTGGGNHYELPVVAIKALHYQRHEKDYYNGRYIHKLESEDEQTHPTDWIRLHANRSYILWLTPKYHSWCQLPDVTVVDITKLRGQEQIEECLTNAGNEMGMPNPIMAAGMSYLHMIGDTAETQKVSREKGFNLELRKWYDVTSCKNAICMKYNITMGELDDNIKALLEMIAKPLTYHKKFITTTAYSNADFVIRR